MPKREQRRWSAVNALVRPHRFRVFRLSLIAALGGFTEAVFLVTATYTSLALAEGEGTIVINGLNLSTNSALWLSGGLIIFRLVTAIIGISLSTGVSSEVITNLRLRLSRSYLEASWAVQNSEPVGQLQQLLVAYTREAATSVSAITSAIVAVLSLTALMGVAVTVNPLASLTVLLVLGLLAAILSPLRRAVNRVSTAALDLELEFTHDVADLVRVGLEIESFGVRRQVITHLEGLIRKTKGALRRTYALVEANTPIYVSLAYVVILVGMVIVATMEIGDLGGMAAVMLVALRSLTYGQGFQIAITTIAERAPILHSLNETITKYELSSTAGGDTVLNEIGPIEVNNLSFGYDSQSLVLDRLSFVIEPGEIIGIIGPSGCGKTTLLHLLLGLHEPTSGSIRINSKQLSEIDLISWSQLIGFVPQDSYLISGNILENICFFRSIDRHLVDNAIEKAHMTEEILAMPDGISTKVGSRGIDLSGGQRQRIAIARALVTKPLLLIMDEPTASLDPGTESKIRETLAGLGADVTVVVVAHRLSTLEECDRIMLIEAGRITAFDRPDVLTRDNASFQAALANAGLS